MPSELLSSVRSSTRAISSDELFSPIGRLAAQTRITPAANPWRTRHRGLARRLVAVRRGAVPAMRRAAVVEASAASGAAASGALAATWDNRFPVMTAPPGGMKSSRQLINQCAPQGTGRRSRHPGAHHQPFGYAERSMADNSLRLRSEVLQGSAKFGREEGRDGEGSCIAPRDRYHRRNSPSSSR
jgi:hypothetical protein